MTNPAASPTVTPTDSDQSLTEAPEATTLRGSLNGDAAPTARPVTRPDDNAGDLAANAVPATDERADASEWNPTPDPNGGESGWWDGIVVGYTICEPANFETRVL